VTALIMLAGLYYGCEYGSTISSVLISTPGEGAALVTVFDGYPMARMGRAGQALAIAAISSFAAGTVSVVLLSVAAPLFAQVALSFGPPEMFVLMRGPGPRRACRTSGAPVPAAPGDRGRWYGMLRSGQHGRPTRRRPRRCQGPGLVSNPGHASPSAPRLGHSDPRPRPGTPQRGWVGCPARRLAAAGARGTHPARENVARPRRRACSVRQARSACSSSAPPPRSTKQPKDDVVRRT
jgi:hypothetical protein